MNFSFMILMLFVILINYNLHFKIKNYYYFFVSLIILFINEAYNFNFLEKFTSFCNNNNLDCKECEKKKHFKYEKQKETITKQNSVLDKLLNYFISKNP